MFRLFLCLLALLAGSTACAAEPFPLLARLRAVESETTEDLPPAPANPKSGPARRTLGQGDFYDPTNPDLRHLQNPDEAMAAFQRDANGYPDWMRLLRSKTIQPKAGLKPGDTMVPFELDVVMRNTKEMPFVRFPHNSHTVWLDCSNCHPDPFEARAGATKIAMADIFRGKFCGRCHDRVAFITFFSCDRCHSVPQGSEVAAPRK